MLAKIKPKKRETANLCETPLNISIMISETDCDETYCRRFKPDCLIKKEITLLNRTYKADYTENAKKTMEPLYRFNLYYFEYAVALGAEYKRTGNKDYVTAFCRLYEDYINAKAPYHPYVISLHIPNILIALELFGDAIEETFVKRIYSELYSQYKYLLSHHERHLLANHYFENLKTTVIASYLFGENDICRKYMKKLYGQVKEQILSDGMHFELSPMYHKIILEDLLRIAKLAENTDFPECEWLKPTVEKMLDASATLEKGMGRTPLFNDSGDNVAKTFESLSKAAKAIFGIQGQSKPSLSESGYYKLYDGNLAVVIDAGIIGPDYNPGHGHCDCLSFELSADGFPVFVNSGTYHYQDKLRKYFRSTQAHNTVKIGSHEQSECWGEHRVARRIKSVKAMQNGSLVCGEYKNYAGEKHKRIFSLEKGILEITDNIESDTKEKISSYLHLAPEFRFESEEKSINVLDCSGKKICRIVPVNCDFILCGKDGEYVYAHEFGKLQKTECVEFTWVSDKKNHGYKIFFENRG